MDPLLLLASIGRTVATVLLGGNLGNDKVREWAGYLNLAAVVSGVVTRASDDLVELDAQLKEAAAEGRGLTAIQRAEWRARSDAASSALEEAADEDDSG